MKKRYFIPLFAIASFLLIVLHVILVTESVSLSLTFVKHVDGIWKLVIIRTFAVLASILAGLLVAFPMAYFTRIGKWLVGLAFPLFGISFVFTPWQEKSMAVFKQTSWEWIFLFVSCGVFWHLGRKVRMRKELAQPTDAPDKNIAA